MDKTTLKTVSVSDKGQIAIPREIQMLLKIKKGDKLVLATKNEKILIQKATSLEEQMESDFEDLLRMSENTLKNLWNNKHDDIWNEYLK